MSQRIRSRGWLGIIFTIVVLAGLTIVIVWQSLSQSTNPDYQMREQQSGVGDYYVNLWVEPTPLTTGSGELSAQMTTIIGTPIDLSYLIFELTPPDSENSTIETEASYQEDGPGQGPAYEDVIQIDEPGTWILTMRYSMGGPEIATDIQLEIEP